MILKAELDLEFNMILNPLARSKIKTMVYLYIILLGAHRGTRFSQLIKI